MSADGEESSPAKPFKLLLSRYCIECAGDSVPAIQRRAADEIGAFVGEARDWLFHTIEVDGGTYLCRGEELRDRWEIFIQKAHYEHLTTTPDDHPDPARQGKDFSIAKADEFPTNNEFAELPMPS